MARPSKRKEFRDWLLQLLEEGCHDGKSILSITGMNQRSLTRLISDLRGEGHRIVAVREGRTWRYRLEGSPEKEGSR